MAAITVLNNPIPSDLRFETAETEALNLANLSKALLSQKRTNSQLAATLVELGELDLADLSHIFALQNEVGDPVGLLSVVSEIRSRLGEMLLRVKQITAHQLEHALELQKNSSDSLSEVLISMGLLTSDDIDTPHIFQRPRQKQEVVASPPLRLGDILLARNEISLQQLQEALDTQQQNGKRLGELLIEKGYVNAIQIGLALELQKLH